MRRALFLILLLPLSACTKPPKKEIVGLRTFEFTGGDIRSGSLSYAGSPPAGGPYNALWQSCGVYTAPIYNEYAVHSLARGALWLTYQPSNQDAAKTLAQSLAQPFEIGTGDQKRQIQPVLLVSPLQNQAAPLVLTAWNAQISAQTPDDPNLRMFVEQFGAAEQAPERGASCKGGFTGTRD